MTSLETDLTQAAEIIADADVLVIAAGAGIGVDSGLPDFRGNTGFWNAYPALAKALLSFTEVASPRTFVQDPELAWGFYGHRLNLYRQIKPHAGFQILQRWMDEKVFSGRVFTSNVDGQFERAGFLTELIHECHGSIHYLQCLGDCRGEVWSASEFNPDVDEDNCRLRNMPPLCPVCGRIARPNILMFGDWNWVTERADRQRRKQANWLAEMRDTKLFIAVVEIGAGTAIPSARRFCHELICDMGARLVRINPLESSVPSREHVGLPMGSLEALTALDKLI